MGAAWTAGAACATGAVELVGATCAVGRVWLDAAALNAASCAAVGGVKVGWLLLAIFRSSHGSLWLH